MKKHNQKLYSKIFILTTITCIQFVCLGNNSVTIALSQMPVTLNPLKATDSTGIRISHLIFQSLVQLDKNLVARPDLAKEWRCQPLSCTFEVPYGHSFSNGRPIQKEDIEFSFQKYRSQDSPFRSAFKNIQQVQITPHAKGWTIDIRLKHPSAPFVASDLPILKILPKKEFLSNPEKFKKIPMGSGSFVLSQKTPHFLELKSRKNNPVQTVTFKVIRDDLVRFQKVLKKDIDIITSDLPYSKVQKIKEMDELPYKVISQEGLSMNYILMNLKDPLMKNLKLRQAIAWGINKNDIIKYHLKNFATPSYTILNPSNPFFFKKIKKYSYNKQKAKKIIRDNQWVGKKIKITTSNNQSVISYARIIAYQMKQIGLQAELQSYEWGTFYKDLSKGHFQIALLRWVGAFDPDIYRLAFHSSEVPPYGRNRGSYINPRLDLLLEKGKKQHDIKKRRDVYNEVQKIISQDLPIIPLWHNRQVSVIKDNIQGYFLPPNGSYDFLLSISKK